MQSIWTEEAKELCVIGANRSPGEKGCREQAAGVLNEARGRWWNQSPRKWWGEPEHRHRPHSSGLQSVSGWNSNPSAHDTFAILHFHLISHRLPSGSSLWLNYFLPFACADSSTQNSLSLYLHRADFCSVFRAKPERHLLWKIFPSEFPVWTECHPHGPCPCSHWP